MPRFYCPTALNPGELLDLPASAARHVQVLRLQPGDTITLFNGGPGLAGRGGDFDATIAQMGRSDVRVQIGLHHPVEREAARPVQLAVGMPANERMDWLVEKAAELGVASIQPLMTERSVLRLSGDRAIKKQNHWQSVAVAACEQCGGNRVPVLHEVLTLTQWLKAGPLQAQTAAAVAAGADASAGSLALLLSLRDGSLGLREAVQQHLPAQRDANDPLASLATHITFLSGPEGGLSASEEEAALATGFKPTTLGPRVLRAETAALAALATLLI